MAASVTISRVLILGTSWVFGAVRSIKTMKRAKGCRVDWVLAAFWSASVGFVCRTSTPSGETFPVTGNGGYGAVPGVSVRDRTQRASSLCQQDAGSNHHHENQGESAKAR